MRCFIAIELSSQIRAEAGRLQRELALPDVPVRWVRPDHMHLTLKFLGEVPDPEIPKISRALAETARRAAAFEIHVVGAGCFPPRGRDVRVVWVGVEDPSGELQRFQEQIEAAAEACGFAREKRPFTAHFTLGRARSPRQAAALRAHLSAYQQFPLGRQSVEQIVLFESVLRKTGAEYRVLVRESLGAGGDAV